ncbi:MAG TPA: biotin/lipoyl-binding protein [bacterium]|nr:biotin/lipoyl-binding protein [bacterium]
MQSKHFLSAALLPFVLVSCGTQEVTAPLPEIRTETARVGHLSDDYRIITTVEGMRMTDLSFKASGRVVSVLVDVGDRVRAGDTIALLGSEEAKASVAGLGESLHAMDTSVASVHTAAESLRNTIDPVNQLYIGRIALAKDDEHRAGINVEIAQSDYALARELERFGVGIASGALALSDESVDQARKNLALARTNYEAGLRVLSGSTTLDSELVDQAQANLDRVRNELAHTESLIASEREAARKSGLSALASAYVVARDARDFIDTELGVTDTNALVDPARYRLLGSKDSTSKTRAEDAFRTFNQSYQTMLAWYEEHIDGRSDVDMETVRTGLRDGLKTLDLLRQALHSFSTVVEQSIAGTDFPQAFIDALKIETTSRLSSLETVILTDNGGGMKGALSAIEAVDAKESLVLGGLQDAVTLAENSLRTARTGL